MSQSGRRSEGEKQNQGEPTHVNVTTTMEEKLSPGLEPKNLPKADDSEKKKAQVDVHMFPGSETSSIEGCEKGPCAGPDCNDGGGGGSRGYGIEEEL